ncbi:DNA/RNA polymerase superfamily protein [Gossypium australe]|uniref:DNA/RNA polymerase superfamily protein n=1 Tax=Gossypium australe TaxID=47621 RepID=A0A5B6WFD3_9ROSI|nr:DNA/RNA polymerase superfamily protein [Gossypium australe]
MLRCCILEFEGSWEKYPSLVEFSYRNNYQSSIKMEPFEVLYGRKCRTPLYWSELISPWKKVLRFGRKRKLSLRFIESYEFIERIDFVAYKLVLPPELKKIHNVFHVLMLRRYRLDPSHLITSNEIELQSDLSYSEELINFWHTK